MIASVFDDNIKKDMEAIGWNPFNSDEEKVINSEKVSFYKGVPVIRTSMDRSGTFLGIFLRDEANVNELKHERGHSWQMMMMSLGTYAYTVAIPSPLKLGPWAEDGFYYDAPWESIADILGGAQHKHNNSNYDEIAWVYYAISMINPLAVRVFWLNF